MLGAGISSRFGLPCKKQWIRIGDDPLWLYATKNISSCYNFKEIFIVSNECEYMSRFNEFFKFIKGGQTRQESLKNAISQVKTPFVMVSDIARPNIPKDLILRLINAKDKAHCVVPVLKVADTVVFGDNYINRDEIKLIQTPQISQTELLKKALNTDIDYTDDSSAIKAMGGQIWYILGDEKAKKITYKDDLKALNLPSPSKDIFTGHGIDIHKFKQGKGMKICGVFVPCEKGVVAHSDGDVGLHALCDAIFGACGLGDIGEFYPDNDKRFKNINSADLLKDCLNIAKSIGFEIINADITIIAQIPKITPYKSQMRKIVANLLGISPSKVNIKATTTEKLGFIGQKEGLGASASVNLKYFDWQKYESFDSRK